MTESTYIFIRYVLNCMRTDQLHSFRCQSSIVLLYANAVCVVLCLRHSRFRRGRPIAQSTRSMSSMATSRRQPYTLPVFDSAE